MKCLVFLRDASESICLLLVMLHQNSFIISTAKAFQCQKIQRSAKVRHIFLLSCSLWLQELQPFH